MSEDNLIERKTNLGSGIVRFDRIRGGKLQRRKLKTSRKGFKIKAGKSVRMKPGEKRKRKLAARRSVRKRAAKLTSILRKRKISISRGKRAGIYK